MPRFQPYCAILYSVIVYSLISFNELLCISALLCLTVPSVDLLLFCLCCTIPCVICWSFCYLISNLVVPSVNLLLFCFCCITLRLLCLFLYLDIFKEYLYSFMLHFPYLFMIFQLFQTVLHCSTAYSIFSFYYFG